MNIEYKTINFNELCIPVKMHLINSSEDIKEADSDVISSNLDKTLNIEYFCKSKEISTLLFEKSYYLIPQKDVEKEYQMLKRAMAANRVVGIAEIIIEEKTRLVALFADKDCIIATILFYENEIKDSPIIFKRKVDKDDLENLKNEINLCTKEFEWKSSNELLML